MTRQRAGRRIRQAFARYLPRLFLRSSSPTPAELGLAGEALAARWLERRGLRVLGRRVLVAGCELDLVCLDQTETVCVEVKTALQPTAPLPIGHDGWLRPNEFRPGRRLGYSRLARQRAAARTLARSLGLDPRRARVDLVEVHVRADGRRVRIERVLDLRRPLT